MPAISRTLLFFALGMVSATIPAHSQAQQSGASAATKEDSPFRYAPDFCDFEITFPEKPLVTQKCAPNGGQCYDLSSYTMVYDLQTTVDVSVSCNPSTPENYERYNERVMKAALTGMVAEKNLSSHDINFRQLDNIRNASLSGTGVRGQQDTIYTSQLWIGQNSVFSIQAELVGAEHPVGDEVFSEILSSIKIKEKPAPEQAAEEKEDDVKED